jgi:hypothetical protein
MKYRVRAVAGLAVTMAGLAGSLMLPSVAQASSASCGGLLTFAAPNGISQIVDMSEVCSSEWLVMARVSQNGSPDFDTVTNGTDRTVCLWDFERELKLEPNQSAPLNGALPGFVRSPC